MSSELFTWTIGPEMEQYKCTENQIIVNLYLCDPTDTQYLFISENVFLARHHWNKYCGRDCVLSLGIIAPIRRHYTRPATSWLTLGHIGQRRPLVLYKSSRGGNETQQYRGQT